MGIPLFLVLLVLLLPWYDRNPHRNPARRPFAMTAGGAFVAIVLILAYVGYYSKPGTGAAAPKPPSPATPSTAVPAVAVTADIKQGAQLFQTEGCIGCHRIHGVGGTVGPDLSSGVLKGKDRKWLIAQIRNPKSHFPNTIMPSYTGPSDQQVNAVVDYLLNVAAGGTLAPTAVPLPTAAAAGPPSTKPVKIPVGPPGQAAYVIGSPERGVVVFTEVCISCHGPLGTDHIPNPGSDDGKIPPLNPINRNLFSKDPQTFAQNIDRFMQHGSTPQGPNPQFQMLAFGEDHSLTQPAISNVEAYVLQLNGVDRAERLHPGVKAHQYFWAVVIVFVAALGGLWIQRGRGKKNG